MLCITCHNRDDVMLPCLSAPVGLLHGMTWTAWNPLSYIAACSVIAHCIAVSVWLPLQLKGLSRWHGIAMTSHQSRPWVSCIGLTMMSAKHWMNWQSTHLLKVRHNDIRWQYLCSSVGGWATWGVLWFCGVHAYVCMYVCMYVYVLGTTHCAFVHTLDTLLWVVCILYVIS